MGIKEEDIGLTVRLDIAGTIIELSIEECKILRNKLESMFKDSDDKLLQYKLGDGSILGTHTTRIQNY